MEGIFHPVHLLLVVLLGVGTLFVPICVLLAVLKLQRIDKSLEVILGELRQRRKS